MTQEHRRRRAELFAAIAVAAGLLAFLPAGAAAPPPERIVFVRDVGEQAELFSVRPDGSGLTRLSRDPYWDTDPAWSPDRRLIASLGAAHLVIRKADGTVVERIPARAPGGASEVRWAPGGRWVSYLAERCVDPDDPRPYAIPNCADLYVVRPDGPAERLLVRNGGVDTLDLESSYSWSPGGRRIVYEANTGGATVLGLVDVASGKSRRIPRTAGSADPAWSPTADLIAFVRALSRGRRGVFVMRSDGSRRRLLTRRGWTERPAWSPNGRLLAYLVAERSRDENRWGVWVSRPDGTRRRRIATATEDRQLAWSPNSTRIAWVNALDRIVVMRVDGIGRPRFVARGREIDW